MAPSVSGRATARAPGRVNLIGEHTDYNDGFVLPIAVDFTTVVTAAARDDQIVRAYTENLDATAEFDLRAPGAAPRRGWDAYVEGVFAALREAGVPVGGAELRISSDVPLGAGLSSSAALEIATALAATRAHGLDVPRETIVRCGRRAEHRFVGTRSGIMDQYVVAFARAEHALLLDCRSLAPRFVPLRTGDARFFVCDSGVRHALADSAYNARRAECAAAVALVAREAPAVSALRDVTPEMLAAIALPEPLAARAAHVVSENARTLAAADALAAGDLPSFGALMAQSHVSLRDRYAVSIPELDELVEAALAAGALGARMTGGGFGGSVVALVPGDASAAFAEGVAERYRLRCGRSTTIRSVNAVEGAVVH